MKLTKKQREKTIQEIIDNDIEQLYKHRDMFNLLYYGTLPYEDMLDEEIIEWYKERELELPKK